ncbi:MAG TPA: CRISPR-associated endonuclease Cas1, partial [Nitrosomonas sp.]|nr:CRISPR-associated endonuclease Cas1 [Nitrosomonas sp.]
MLAIGALLRKALTFGMLKQAWEKVFDNNGMAGVDGESIDVLVPQIDTVLRQLAKDVIHDNYRPQPLLRIWVERPGKLPRGLEIPTVRDRILQTSLTLVLTPKVEAELEDCSYAYRKGRGVRLAVERIGFYQRQGYHWIVDADIEAFFDTIPHADLLARLQTIAAEPALINLVEQWLTAPIQENGQLTVPHQGIPQGSPISPMLANLYLDTLDEALLDADHILIRYADDFIVLAKSRKRAEAALELTKDVLDRLTLRLNPLKTRIVHFDEGIEFLGWYFVRSLAIPKNWQKTPPRNFQIPSPPSVASAADNAAAQTSLEAIPEQTPFTETTPSPNIATTASADEAAHEAHDFGPVLPPLAPLQRTLYLVDKKARLSVDNQRFRVERDDKTLLSLPAHQVDQIMLFGPIQVTTQALQLAARNTCSLSYLSYLGRYYGRFEPANDQQITLLQAQFSCHTDTAFQLDIARNIVAAKLQNCRLVLTRNLRHNKPDSPDLSANLRLKQIEQSLKTTASMESLRGSEGAAAALYWRAFAGL